jgi:hypothetical protein
LQSEPLFRGTYKANVARFNLENRLTFVVERTFGTVEAALSFIGSHADQAPAQGTLTVYNLSARGQISRSLANAVITEVECVEHVGVSCKFRYILAGNGAWQ